MALYTSRKCDHTK